MEIIHKDTSPVTLSFLSPETKTKYTQFLLNTPESLVYYSVPYTDLISQYLNTTPRTIIAQTSQEIIGAFPLMIGNGPYGKIINSLPFYGSNGGPLAKNQNPEIIQKLLDAYTQLLKTESIAAATWISNPFAPILESQLSFQLRDERIAQFTRLPQDDTLQKIETQLLSQYESSTRRNIRKAIKKEIQITVENDNINFLFQSHHANMTAIGGSPKEKKFFELIPHFFKPNIDYKIYIARQNNQPIAALLLFFFNKTVEYFTPTTLEAYRSDQPLALIIFKAMCDAAQTGYQWWNWGGTWLTQNGVYQFKKKWGTIEKPYYYYTTIQNPSIYQASKETVLSAYPNQFVIPFNALNS